MPNYKVFQDFADNMRVKIYGADSANNTTPLLTTSSGQLNITGNVGVSGPVAVSGSVAVSGPVAISGSVGVSGPVAISGSVGVSGPVTISGSVAVSGPVAISGTVGVSGIVQTSGYVFNASGDPLYTRTPVVDSGPVITAIVGSGSGAFGGTWDVLGFTSWTFSVKYSGENASGVSARLQISATGSGTDFVNVDPAASDFSGQSWNFFTTTYQVRYARMYYTDITASSGNLILYFQAQY